MRIKAKFIAYPKKNGINQPRIRDEVTFTITKMDHREVMEMALERAAMEFNLRATPIKIVSYEPVSEEVRHAA